MTNDLEQRLAAALYWRAADDVDADRLLDAAVTRGRTRQRQRRLAGGLGAAGLACLTAAALAAVPLLRPAGGAPGGLGGAGNPTPTPRLSNIRPPDPIPLPAGGPHPVPRLAADVPGAAQRPDIIATDPLALHFGLDDMPAPVESVTWTVDEGMELVALYLAGPDGASLGVSIQVGQRPPPRYGSDGEPTVNTSRVGEINGRPLDFEEARDLSGVRERSVRWSPVDGVHARIFAPDLATADLVRLARLVRFDRGARCAVPVRLTAMPAGWAVLGCSITLPPHPPALPWRGMGWVAIGSPAGARIEVSADDPYRPKDRGGKKVRLPGGTVAADQSIPGEPRLVIYDLGGMTVSVNGISKIGRDTVIDVAGGVRAAGDMDRPDLWLPSPVG